MKKILLIFLILQAALCSCLFASVIGALAVRDLATVLIQTVVVAFSVATCPLDHENNMK